MSPCQKNNIVRVKIILSIELKIKLKIFSKKFGITVKKDSPYSIEITNHQK